MAASKLLFPLVGAGIAAAAFLTRSSSASATPAGSGGSSGKPPAGPIPGVSPTVSIPGSSLAGLPPEIIRRMVDALATGDPAKIRAEADRLQRDGFSIQAADLRAAAAEIEKAASAVPVPGHASPIPAAPSVPSTPFFPPATPAAPVFPPAITSPGIPQIVVPEPRPTPSPTLPSVVLSAPGQRRFVTVKSGEGPAQITERVLGGGQGNKRWKELVAANVPPKTVNPSTGNFKYLNPGEKLLVPANWPNSPHLTAESGAPTASPSLPAGIPAAVPSTPSAPIRRVVTVLKGEGPSQITARVLGPGSANRWKELVAANVPPKKKDPKSGNFTMLNPGEKLLVPASWPDSPQIVFGEDPHEQKNIRAGKIALGLHFGNLSPETLAEWKRREGLAPTGEYGPEVALILCYRYGFVPPAPTKFRSVAQARNFANAMKRRARQDPQRADEYTKVVRDTLGACR